MIPGQPITTSQRPLAEVVVEGELSPFEDEKIYRILREKFKLQHPSYSNLYNEELATGVNMVFHHPYSSAFFTGLFREGWRDLKDLLKEIRHRRGNAGAGFTLTFKDNESTLVFVSGVLEDREFRSCLDQIGYLPAIIGQMLQTWAAEKRLVTVQTTFDKRVDRWAWFRGFTSTNEGYVFDEVAFRWVKP